MRRFYLQRLSSFRGFRLQRGRVTLGCWRVWY